jgi:hypothetical protein
MFRSVWFVSTFTLDRPASDDLHKIPFALFRKALSKPSCGAGLGGIEFKCLLEASRGAVWVRRVRRLQIIHPKVRKGGGKRRGSFQRGDETLVCFFISCKTVLV